MDDRMNELMEGVWANWTDEQKAKAAACKTAEELEALVEQEGFELPDDMVDAVAGGKFPWRKVLKIGGKVANQILSEDG